MRTLRNPKEKKNIQELIGIISEGTHAKYTGKTLRRINGMYVIFMSFELTDTHPHAFPEASVLNVLVINYKNSQSVDVSGSDAAEKQVSNLLENHGYFLE